MPPFRTIRQYYCKFYSLNAGWYADNVELGTACGKLHRVSALTITDAGMWLESHHLVVYQLQVFAAMKQTVVELEFFRNLPLTKL